MIKLAFKNPLLIVVLAIITAVISWVSLNKLSVDILPEFKKNGYADFSTVSGYASRSS